MSPPKSPSPEVVEQAVRFRAALTAAGQRGVSRRKIATAALGQDATKDEIKNMLSQMTKWAKADHGPNDESARRLGKAFVEVGLPEFNADYFMKPRGEPTWADRMRAIAEQTSPTREEYQQGLAALRKEIIEGREAEERRHQELLEEIRRLREAS